MLGDVLAQDEVPANVEIHDLVPGFHRVVFGGRTPGRARVVHEDVDRAHALQGFVREAMDVFLLGAVSSDPARVDASSLKLGGRLLQVFGLARRQHDARPRLTQRMGHLQAEATRAAGHQCGLASQVKELFHGSGHVCS